MYKVAVVLGIRPDFIRTSKVLKLLRDHPKVDLQLIHTGQHYDKNLNDIFFEEMEIPPIDHQLNTKGKNHNEQHSRLIIQLSNVLDRIRPDICLFLGDANATIGCIAPLKLAIPIAHIEAGMRSYDWSMPEERNRVIIDRVSDVLYVYQEDYRVQLVQEGIDPTKIVVTGNVIVDVLRDYEFYFDWHGWDSREGPRPYGDGWIEKDKYALMTLHRNEHMVSRGKARAIIRNVGEATKGLDIPVVLVEMPRLKQMDLDYPDHFLVVPPLGFFEFVMLEKNAMIEYTDSGTNQEVASIVGTPCVVTRTCTERPECRKCGTTVLSGYERSMIFDATEIVLNARRKLGFTLGDGNASFRIVEDLVNRLDNDFRRCHSDRMLYVDSFKTEHFRLL